MTSETPTPALPAPSDSGCATPTAAAAGGTAPSVVVPKTMKGVFYEDYGSAEVLRYGSLATPRRDDRQVRIHVVAASVNPVDWRMRAGEMRYLLPGGFPRIPGYDVAGYLREGEELLHLPRGTRVMAMLDSVYGGASAEWAVCSPHALTAIPDPMPFDEAAALPLAGSTALQALREHGRICVGDRVLVNGASGAVGGFAVQIAKAYGAHVTGVASGPAEEHVRSLGADEFIDYHRHDFAASSDRWDLIFDAAGKSSYRHARPALRSRGRFVSTEPDVSGLVASIATLASTQRGRVMLVRSRREDLEELVRLYNAGQLRVPIDTVLPLEQTAEAHRRSERGEARGKIVLRTGVKPLE